MSERQRILRENVAYLREQGESDDYIKSYLEENGSSLNEVEAAGAESVLPGWAHSALAGPLFNFSDELVARGRSALTDMSYDQALAAERQAANQFREDAPWVSTGLELAGTLPTLAIPGLGWARGASLGARVGRVGLGAASGAGTGALATYGADEGGEGLGNRMAEGGAIGGLVGGVIPAVGGLVRGGVNMMKSRAPQRLAAMAEDAGTTPQEMAARLRESSGELMGADLGAPMQRATRAIHAKGGEPGALAEEVLTARDRGQAGRISESLRRTLAADEGLDAMSDRILAERGMASEMYQRAERIAVDPDIDWGFLDNKRFLDVRPSAQRMVDGPDVPKFTPDSPPRTLADVHALRMALDDKVDSSFRSGNNKIARKYAEDRKSVDQILKKSGSEYGLADEIWSTKSQLLEAGDFGLNWRKVSEKDLLNRLSGMNEAELQMFREGLASDIESGMRNNTFGRDQVRSFWKNQALVDQLKLAFPSEEAFQEFQRKVNQEQLMRSTKDVVLGGSPTARITEDVRMLDMNPADFLELLTNPQGVMARQGIGAALDKTRARVGDRTAKELSRALLEPDPQQAALAIEDIMTRAPGQAFNPFWGGHAAGILSAEED